MLNKDVVFLWSACAVCTCGRVPAPHPAEARRIGMGPDDVTRCGGCGTRVMDWPTDREVDEFIETIEDAADVSVPGVTGEIEAVPEGGVILPFRRRGASA